MNRTMFWLSDHLKAENLFAEASKTLEGEQNSGAMDVNTYLPTYRQFSNLDYFCLHCNDNIIKSRYL